MNLATIFSTCQDHNIGADKDSLTPPLETKNCDFIKKKEKPYQN